MVFIFNFLSFLVNIWVFIVFLDFFLSNFFIFHENGNNPLLSHFIEEACGKHCFFAHKMYWALNSLGCNLAEIPLFNLFDFFEIMKKTFVFCLE